MTILATIESNAGHVFAHCGNAGCNWRSDPYEDQTEAATSLARHLIAHDVGRMRERPAQLGGIEIVVSDQAPADTAVLRSYDENGGVKDQAVIVGLGSRA